jgi:hypothetical protein
MKRFLLCLVVLYTAMALGCPGDKDKGINKDRDRQQPDKRSAK